MSMIQKAPTKNEYRSYEFHACMPKCITACRHVNFENQLYTHENSEQKKLC